MKAAKAVLLSFAVIVALSIGASGARAAQKKVDLEVVGLLCGADTYRVGAVFDEIKGISDYEMDTSRQSALVTFDDEATSVEAIGKALDENGYGVNKATFLAE